MLAQSGDTRRLKARLRLIERINFLFRAIADKSLLHLTVEAGADASPQALGLCFPKQIGGEQIAN